MCDEENEEIQNKIVIKEVGNGFIVHNCGESMTLFERKEDKDEDDREELQTMVNLLKHVCVELGIKLDTRHRLNIDIKIIDR